MNPKTLREAKKIGGIISKKARKLKGVSVVIAPPAPFIKEIRSKGAQDLFYGTEGAYTGGVSAGMLKDLGVEYVIVGHSERRAQGDTTEIVNEKMKTAISAKLTPILCVGERERDDHHHYLHFVREEIKAALKGIPKERISRVVIAYEPIWAIGKRAKGVLPPEEALHMNIYIRKVISDIAGPLTAKKIKILYGGSVDVKNSSGFISIGKMDGLLVGRESLNPKNFLEIAKLSAKSSTERNKK